MSLGLNQGSGAWDGLLARFKPVCVVPYRDLNVHVYEKKDAELREADEEGTRYFCTPVLLLQPATANYQYLALKCQHAVSFDVVTWSEDVESAVLDYMQQQMKMDVGRAQVHPIPFEAALLTRRTPGGAHECPDEWRASGSRSFVTFTLTCPTKGEAESVARAMRTQPRQFDSAFEVELKLAPRQNKGHELAIRVGPAAFNGELFRKLNKKFPGKSEALLNAEDARRLLSEAKNGIVVLGSNNRDAVLSGESEDAINAALRNMLVRRETALGGDDGASTGKLWNSVFWDQDNSRPDRVAFELNRVLGRLAEETRERLVEFVGGINDGADSFDRLVSSLGASGEACASSTEANSSGALRSLLRTVMDHSEPSSGFHVLFRNLIEPGKKGKKLGIEERVSALMEALANVEWRAGRFVPKAMTLYQINFRQISGEIKVPVWLTSDVFTAPVNVNTDAKMRNFHLDEDFGARMRHLEEQSNDWKFGLEVLEKETARRLDALNKNLDQLTQRMVNMELIMNNNSNPNNQLSQRMANIERLMKDSSKPDKKNQTEADQKLQEKMNQFKGQLTKLISDARAESTKMNKLESKMELLKNDLLANDASLRGVIDKEKQSLLREVSSVKSTNAREHEDMKSLFASVKKSEQEAKLVRQSVDKVTSEVAQVRQELAHTGNTLKDVSQSTRNVQARLAKAEENFKNQTESIGRQSARKATRKC